AEAVLSAAASEALARGGGRRTRPRCRRRHGLEGPGCVLGDGAPEEHAVRGRAGGESNPEASLRGLVEREVDARAVAGRAQVMGLQVDGAAGAILAARVTITIAGGPGRPRSHPRYARGSRAHKRPRTPAPARP